MLVLFVWINIIFDLNPKYEAISIFIERGRGCLLVARVFIATFGVCTCMPPYDFVLMCAKIFIFELISIYLRYCYPSMQLSSSGHMIQGTITQIIAVASRSGHKYNVYCTTSKYPSNTPLNTPFSLRFVFIP